jgi:hypothetical protein
MRRDSGPLVFFTSKKFGIWKCTETRKVYLCIIVVAVECVAFVGILTANASYVGVETGLA